VGLSAAAAAAVIGSTEQNKAQGRITHRGGSDFFRETNIIQL